MPKSEEELEAEKKAAKKAAKKKRKAEEAAAEEAASKPESPKKKKKKDKKAKSSDEEEEAAEPPKKKEKKEKKEKKAKKAKKESSDEEEEEPAAEKEEEEEASSFKVHKKAEAGEGGANPTGTCEVYMGNLSFQIDEATLQDHVKDCGKITNFKWLEHTDTGRFKGAGFITFETPEAAAKAVAMNGTEVLGRPMKVDFSTPRANKGGGGEVRPMQEKPEGCTTLFCGNLSFNVTEEAVHEFFKECGAISNIRWLEDKETGQFKGCGFVEFSDPDGSLDKAALLNGKELLGRSLRLDFATPRKPRTW